MSINIQEILDEAVKRSRLNKSGQVANYIPELANVNQEIVIAAVELADGTQFFAGDDIDTTFTLQSVAKLIPLIGLIEECGIDQVFTWINAEPSEYSFSSISQLDAKGPIPSNPMLNAGAIALCSRIPGNTQERAQWLDMWVEKLFGKRLKIDGRVFSSEKNTSDKNKALAYLLKNNNMLPLSVEDTLETYCYLCSVEVTCKDAASLSNLLSLGGKYVDGNRVISVETNNVVVSIMATCGLYNESGMHLVRTGMPAKSGVSGLMIAMAPGRGGIAVYSPRLNSKGGSVCGHMVLGYFAKHMQWHFASPLIS